MSNLLVQEIALGYIGAQQKRLDYLLSQDMPDYVRNICEETNAFLTKKHDIRDSVDLLVLKNEIMVISELIGIFTESIRYDDSAWVLPLIKEFYGRCEIDYSQRNVMVLYADGMGDYYVSADVLSNCDFFILKKYSPIDVFTIPIEMSSNLSSIALIAHEVGHIYWSKNYSIIQRNINDLVDYFDKYYGESHGTTIFSEKISPEKIKENIKQTANHIEEYLCDYIGYFILGPVFDFSLMSFFVDCYEFENHGTKTHPSVSSRVHLSYKRIKDGLGKCQGISVYISRMLELFNNDIYMQKVDEYYANMFLTIKGIIGEAKLEDFYQTRDLNEIWDKVRPELDAVRPPIEKVGIGVPESISPTEALLASIIYYYSGAYKEKNVFYVPPKNSKSISDEINEEKKKGMLLSVLIEHLKYSISIYEFVAFATSMMSQATYGFNKWRNPMWGMRIKETGGDLNPLIIVPNIDPIKQYTDNSIDMRLGGSFLISKGTRYTHIDPNPEKNNQDKYRLPSTYYQVNVGVGEKFILHPHQFVLACTFEYVSLPYDYYALVLGRSSWGRMGLNIATATTVQCGYKGCLTLELRNLSELPLPLTVGTRIAQLCLIPVPGGQATSAGYFSGRDSKYIAPVKAEMPKIWEDKDWSVLKMYKENIC